MKKPMRIAVLAVFVLTTASLAFAHEEHKHKLLGTVDMIHENHLTLSLKDGGEKIVNLTEKTQILKGEDKAGRSVLEKGVRVSVEVDNDDNALTIRVAAEAEHKTD